MRLASAGSISLSNVLSGLVTNHVSVTLTGAAGLAFCHGPNVHRYDHRNNNFIYYPRMTISSKLYFLRYRRSERITPELSNSTEM